MFWDEDKYAKATQAIYSLEIKLAMLCEQFRITNDVFIQYLAVERKYLQDLTEPSPMTTLKSQYVQALNDLSQCQLEWTAARTATNEVFTSIASVSILSVINQTQCHVDTVYSKLQNAESYVETLENGLLRNGGPQPLLSTKPFVKLMSRQTTSKRWTNWSS
ncbi:hypothetical protein L208DRAFT_1542235 [Tricholoma matsutake]|nr:hypothetical protein L208DRAFT_1542235 [Tricholoma matsutake 945]